MAPAYVHGKELPYIRQIEGCLLNGRRFEGPISASLGQPGDSQLYWPLCSVASQSNAELIEKPLKTGAA